VARSATLKVISIRQNQLGDPNMAIRSKIVEFSWLVHDLLSQYIEVHDDVFKFSMRHAIPIPGIFKPIDFNGHLIKAERIRWQLEEINDGIIGMGNDIEGLEGEYLKVLSKYIRDLIETIIKLKVVLGALYAKSQSFVNSSYNWDNYKNDLAAYEQSVSNYMAIGKELNELFQAANN
jgi:hypothetical protein